MRSGRDVLLPLPDSADSGWGDGGFRAEDGGARKPRRHLPPVLRDDVSARKRGKAARDSREIGHHDCGGEVTCKRE